MSAAAGTKVEVRVYRIGFENSPPVHFIDKDGRATGLAVELVREAARRRGIRLQWLVMPESSEDALKAKKVDLWPMMTIRPERKGIVYITETTARHRESKRPRDFRWVIGMKKENRAYSPPGYGNT